MTSTLPARAAVLVGAEGVGPVGRGAGRRGPAGAHPDAWRHGLAQRGDRRGGRAERARRAASAVGRVTAMSSPCRLIFETHATSVDNEAGVASGWADVALSPAGIEQARALGVRRAGETLAAVFCSDLERAWNTAAIAFGARGLPIVRDARLRECDYGALTQRPTAEIEMERAGRILYAISEWRKLRPGGQARRALAGRDGAALCRSDDPRDWPPGHFPCVRASAARDPAGRGDCGAVAMAAGVGLRRDGSLTQRAGSVPDHRGDRPRRVRVGDDAGPRPDVGQRSGRGRRTADAREGFRRDEQSKSHVPVPSPAPAGTPAALARWADGPVDAGSNGAGRFTTVWPLRRATPSMAAPWPAGGACPARTPDRSCRSSNTGAERSPSRAPGTAGLDARTRGRSEMAWRRQPHQSTIHDVEPAPEKSAAAATA